MIPLGDLTRVLTSRTSKTTTEGVKEADTCTPCKVFQRKEGREALADFFFSFFSGLEEKKIGQGPGGFGPPPALQGVQGLAGPKRNSFAHVFNSKRGSALTEVGKNCVCE